jgi:hypothetical protein
MRIRTSLPSALAGLLGLAVVTTGCDIRVNENGVSLDIAEGKATDEWARTYTLTRGGRLEIVNVNGTIEAFPATGSDVTIHVRREVKAQNDEAAREVLQKLEMGEEVSADRVKVEGRFDRGQAPAGFGRRAQVTMHYRVSVPPGLDVSLRTENGGVRLENVQGRFAAASTNGGVTGRGLSGALEATTVNGGIQVELTAVTGEVRIVTVNGGIRLDLPADVDATLAANAVNGGVTVDDALSLTATERDRRRISGRLNDGGPAISVQTTNGGIRISVRDGSSQ